MCAQGCCGSSEAAENTDTSSADGLLPNERYERAIKCPLTPGHKMLSELIDLFAQDDENGIEAWLAEVDATRALRITIEEESGKSTQQFKDWLSLVQVTLDKEDVTLRNLERNWKVMRTKSDLPPIRSLSDENVASYKPSPDLSGLENDRYERCLKTALPQRHAVLSTLVLILKERDSGLTWGWIKEIEETRSRRLEIEDASGGESFTKFKEWVALIEAMLSEKVVTTRNLERAWKVGVAAARD